ncbi:MAG: GGDEF domain-containing protein, partial [Actinomycetota bacterium]|nr:GGDEF domain-containing protein [Actinomycetota bacterium]
MHRFEFLLPVRTADGVLVMEVDQRADIIEGVLGDLRIRKALGLLLVAAFTVPLSYLLGGRSLRRRQSKADQMADTDALTGVAGRRPFRPLLQAALADPDVPSVALALIDVDRFKQLNDHLGHSYGDRVLVALGESFEALRSSDSAFRVGGDEFAVVLPHADDEQAVDVLERVRVCLESRVPDVTVSCGVASVRPDEEVSLQELWERCDSALYEA